tara:strand:- start:502 stop:915 length:414 start_codon:yes stop_codon:yes gene_type:complete
MARPTKRRTENYSFAGIPRIVLDSADYINLSGNAVKLLVEFSRQFKGKNNGDITAAWSLMRRRGFKSKATLSRAVSELMAANIITRTREGAFSRSGPRCALYALNWQSIDECGGKLDVPPTKIPIRKFSLEGKPVCK